MVISRRAMNFTGPGPKANAKPGSFLELLDGGASI